MYYNDTITTDECASCKKKKSACECENECSGNKGSNKGTNDVNVNVIFDSGNQFRSSNDMTELNRPAVTPVVINPPVFNRNNNYSERYVHIPAIQASEKAIIQPPVTPAVPVVPGTPPVPVESQVVYPKQVYVPRAKRVWNFAPQFADPNAYVKPKRPRTIAPQFADPNAPPNFKKKLI
jgi:hypothetical protein